MNEAMELVKLIALYPQWMQDEEKRKMIGRIADRIIKESIGK